MCTTVLPEGCHSSLVFIKLEKAMMCCVGAWRSAAENGSKVRIFKL